MTFWLKGEKKDEAVICGEFIASISPSLFDVDVRDHCNANAAWNNYFHWIESNRNF
jgi:hypothetical protein